MRKRDIDYSYRIGEIRKNNFGTKMKIIKYKEYNNILVEFQDEYKTIVKTRYDAFNDGRVRNPYDKQVFGVACYGFDRRDKNNNIVEETSYHKWEDMIKRCYSDYKRKTYIGCSVCNEWLCYKNFKEWYNENYWCVEKDKMCLDKDILVKGNKIYSPETCVIVPNRINVLFIKSNKTRGKFPIGVSYHNKKKKYTSNCYVKGTSYEIGLFNNPIDAFYAYKKFKENYIKQIADEYKFKYKNFPNNLYDAMYKYEVEITD